jgi:Na+-translocating ferredoxin:NAD+ oxidoreductase RNF subunit RnfB
MSSLAIAAGVLGALGLVLTTALMLAHRFLAVAEDPRTRVLENALPGNNCGACGFPGCQGFAEALAAGEAQPGQCTVSTQVMKERIAEYLDTSVGEIEKRVARLACAGGDNVARRHAHYSGPATCSTAVLVGGGGKVCAWGCLGFGDCLEACEFDAIRMDQHGLPVVDETLCTCKNLEKGNNLVDDCQVACTACGKCAFDAPDVIHMENNLPVIDYAASQPRNSIERCPTGAIVWIEDGVPERGRESVNIVRQAPLPIAVS